MFKEPIRGYPSSAQCTQKGVVNTDRRTVSCFKYTARAAMKRVVKNIRSKRIIETICVALAGAGIASYVTLVSLLTQKESSDVARVAQAALTKGPSQTQASLVRQQQTKFVSEIIRLHNPKHSNVEPTARLIVEESAKAKVDPLFVAAVIRSESMFKPSAISPRGAKGLMQIMPATGRYVSERENITLGKTADLHDPTTNLRVGIAYLKYLDRMFKGNRERMLIAYNWGPANVKLALRGNARTPSESVTYAKKILAAHREWRTRFSMLAANVRFDDSMLG